MEADTGTCGTCGAAVIWLWTPRGKKIPVDPEQVLGGNILIEGDQTQFLTKVEIEEMKESVEAAYQSHFVSCPDAAAHRRR